MLHRISGGAARSVRKFLQMHPSKVTRFIAVTAILAILLPAASAFAKKQADGGYDVKVAGDYSGNGTADVTTTNIKVSAKVRDASGNVLDFSFDLPLTNGRFNGQGSVGGMTCRVSGRVDGGDPVPGGKGKGKNKSNQEVVKNARISVVFTSLDGHVGRVVGDH